MKKSSTKKLFQPLIASSLAMFLGANALGAVEFVIGKRPPHTVWGGLLWRKDDLGLYQPCFINGVQKDAHKLSISYGNTSGSWNDPSRQYTAMTTDSSFSIKGEGDGMQIDNGNGILDINLIAGKSFYLDVSNKNSKGKYSFIGNIEIWGAQDTTSFTTSEFNDSESTAMDYKELSKFSLTFNGDVKGNITIRNQNYRNNNNYGTGGTITFKGSSGLEGDLILTHDGKTGANNVLGAGLTQGKHTIAFGDSTSPNSSITNTITGDLRLGFGENDFKFYNSAKVGGIIDAGFIGQDTGISGSQQAGDPADVNRVSKNTFTFYGLSEVGGVVNSNQRNVAIQSAGNSSNTMEFGGDSAIKGDIQSLSSSLGGKGINILTFKGDAVVNGNIIADSGENTLIFEKDVQFLALSENGSSHTNDSDFGVIVARGGGSNTIFVENGDLTLGSFSSNVVGSSYGDATGSSIYAYSGNNSNTITLNKDGAVLTLAGKITSGGGSAGNTINFGGDSGVLQSGDNALIYASGITNINARNLKIKTQSGSRGILTTTSGTTNINLRAGEEGNLDGSIVTTGGITNINFYSTNSVMSGEIQTGNGASTNLVFKSKNSTLALSGTNNTVSTLRGAGNSTIILAEQGRTGGTRIINKTLTIGSDTSTNALAGNFNVIVQADKWGADKIEVKGMGSNGSLTIQAQGELNELLSITRADNVQVAEVGSNNIFVQGGKSQIDGVVLDLVLQEDTSKKGDYYIDSIRGKGIDTAIQDSSRSALTVNYDLFMANFNSLNKRMGELRDNPYSQGIWARVFGGKTSNEFGTGSETDFITAQMGYDYGFTSKDAKNYLGIAIAYGKSWTKSNIGVGVGTSILDDINSNMVEVGIYNSYVADSGWYNDTILKFDYIMSDFTLTAGSNTTDNNTSNFAVILSDELGYRYKFGSDKSWYIDPQVEVSLSYFDQSSFNHTLNTTTNFSMNVVQDAILTLRTRAGLSIGKKLSFDKGFASLYVGAFYEYDYNQGGEARTEIIGYDKLLKSIESNGRAVINLGSNIEVAEGVRMYLDFEKTFGGSINIDYQVNLGARFSFGEKNSLSAQQEQQRQSIAPLKVESQEQVPVSQESNSQEQLTPAQ